MTLVYQHDKKHEESIVENYKMWIDGKWVSAVSGETYTVLNPATGEEIAQVPKGDERDVELAVRAARKAFPAWSNTPVDYRVAVALKLSELLKQEMFAFADIDTLDHGTPCGLAYILVSVTSAYLEFNAQAARGLMGNVMPISPSNLHYFKREPVGVCALITPWNVPLVMVAMKLAAALVTGNTCVIKPPSVDSLAALKFGTILEKAGLPQGTVNIITGPGGSVGNSLAAHPDVDLVSFTGSSETGRRIMAAASQSTKRVTLELGGKNPFIILDDADLETTAEKAVAAAYANSGMVCAAPGRFYIPEKKYDEFVELFVANAKKMVVGLPDDGMTEMGPLVSAEHRDRVEGYIQSGLDEGARLVLGGKRPTEPPMDKGYYVMPTAFADVTQNMTIAREEIFGPVACMMKYSSESEVIDMANDNEYGLCASVWTRDLIKADRFINELEAGAVYVNQHGGIPPEMPWGGVKNSGIGKENGIAGLEGYTQLKVVAINHLI